MLKNKLLILILSFGLYGCFGTSTLKVVDFTDGRVTDLSLTKKVIGKRNFLFFSYTKMGYFLEGSIVGMITDYYGNPIEGVTVKAVSDVAKGEEQNILEENASSIVSLNFTPGVSDSMGIYKIRFSLPVVDDMVDVRGKLIYNPGWEQQKINLGKTYEPQIKESPFRLYYNLDTGFLAFAEGPRSVIVEPVGEGVGKMKKLPGKTPPKTEEKKAEQKTEEKNKNEFGNEDDLFKAFGF